MNRAVRRDLRRDAARPRAGGTFAWRGAVGFSTLFSIAITTLWMTRGGGNAGREAWDVALAVLWGIIAFVWCWGGAPRPSTRALLCGALLVRFPLLWVEPAWSDDLYRYRWEGYVQWHGVNPYVVAPADRSDLDPLRGEAASGADSGDDGAPSPGLLDQINHPRLPTIYPPAAEILFAVGALLGAAHSSFIAKLLLVSIEMAALAAIHRAGPRTWRRFAVAPMMALHPLFALEVAGNGHLDILVVAWMTLFLIAWRRRLPALAGAALALAAASKLLPALLLPYALLQRRRGRARLAAAFVATIALLYLPYAIGAGRDVFGSLGTYSLKWEANAVVFPAIEWIVERSGLAARLDAATWRPPELAPTVLRRLLGFHPEARHAQQIAKRIAALIGLIVAASVAWAVWLRGPAPTKGVRRLSLDSAAFVLFATVLLLSPVIYPWYLLLLFPMLALRPLSMWRWIALSAPLLYAATGAVAAPTLLDRNFSLLGFFSPAGVVWGWAFVWLIVRPVLAHLGRQIDIRAAPRPDAT
jgi:hypothetical protein